MSDIKTRPTAGFQYRVVSGDRIDNIEKAAYGYVTGVIEAANPQLAARPISLENRPTIYPGDVLLIPINSVTEALKTEQTTAQLGRKGPEELTIIVGNREIQYDSARVVRTMDTAADAWTARIAWTPGADRELDALLLPYSYPRAQVFIGDNLLITGVLYSVAPEISEHGLVLSLEGYSYTADIIDSTMPTPYTAEKITLQQRAAQMLQNIGIKAVFEADAGEAFDRVTGEVEDTIFQHLQSLAAQRALLISSTPEGNLLFTRTSTGAPVGTLQSGNPFPLGWGAKFDGRLLYNRLTAIGQSPGSPSKSATVVDDNIPRSRFMTFQADETTDGNIETAAAWRRSKQFADALTIPFPVSGWYAPNSSLWRENTRVTVVSPEIFVPNGFTFLIRQVEYVVENSGKTATLSLVPPEVYTGERIVLPWEAA